MASRTRAYPPTDEHTHNDATATPARTGARDAYARPELVRMDVLSTAANPFRADGEGTTLRDS